MVSSDFEVSSIKIAVKVSHSCITAVQTSSNSLSNINDISIYVQQKSILEVRLASTAAWDETCLSLLKKYRRILACRILSHNYGTKKNKIMIKKLTVPTFITCNQWLNWGGTRRVRSDVSMQSRSPAATSVHQGKAWCSKNHKWTEVSRSSDPGNFEDGRQIFRGTNHELLINQQGERTNPRYRPRHTEKEARFLRRWHFLGLSLVPAILGRQTLFLGALIQFQGSVYF